MKQGPAKGDTTQSFRWIEPALGKDRSCLHGLGKDVLNRVIADITCYLRLTISMNGLAKIFRFCVPPAYGVMVPPAIADHRESGLLNIAGVRGINAGRCNPFSQDIANLSSHRFRHIRRMQLFCHGCMYMRESRRNRQPTI